MREYRENEKDQEADKIDINDFLLDMIRGVKKLWWLVIGLAILFGVKSYLQVSTGYQPNYVASATMAVTVKGSKYNYVNVESARQMEEVFPYILTSGILEDVVAEDLGMDRIPGTITASAEEGINLFTLSVSALDAQMAYDILQSVIENYPNVARFVIGETSLKIMDETGVPEDNEKRSVLKGTVKRGIAEGTAVGLAILVLYVLTRHTVKSRKELKRQINLEDYGSVPYVQRKKRRKKENQFHVTLLDDRVPQVYLEAVRKLGIKVMKEMEQKEYQTLMVTSSVPGEGKTTLAVNLAIALAKQGKDVILVDADLRHPSVAEHLKNCTIKKGGLGAVLRGEKTLENTMSEVNVSSHGSLRFLPVTEPQAQDVKLLGTAAMKKVIKQLKEQADVVIVDTAPSELLADAPALAKYMEAVLYVVKYDHAKVRQIRTGVQALAMSGVDILGYAFNADPTGARRGYGYGYGYGGYRRYGSYGSYRRSVSHQKDNSGRVLKD